MITANEAASKTKEQIEVSKMIQIRQIETLINEAASKANFKCRYQGVIFPCNRKLLTELGFKIIPSAGNEEYGTTISWEMQA